LSGHAHPTPTQQSPTTTAAPLATTSSAGARTELPPS